MSSAAESADHPASPDDPGDDSVLAPEVDAGERATPVEPGAPVPDLHATAGVIARRGGGTLGVTVLATLAVLYTLYFARAFLRPIAFALLLDFLFSPLVRAMARVRIRPAAGAALVVLALVGGMTLAAFELAAPVQGWAARAPATVATARERLRERLAPFERVRQTAERVQEATAADDTPSTSTVIVQGPSILSRVFGTTQRFAADLLEVLILLYFLLAAGDLFLQKVVKMLPRDEDRQTVITIARRTESSISTYLLTAAMVNVGEGLLVAGALYLLGLPNPLLWGALVAILEFVPYLGAATMVIVLALAALTTFDNVGHALLVPAAFLAINLIQANFISPLLLADRLTLNPVAIFVGLAFWWWIWGVPGAFIAVPLLAALKIVCDHVASLAALGEFLGRRDEHERRTTVRASPDAPDGGAVPPAPAGA